MKKNVISTLIASLVIFLLGIIICSTALIYATATDVKLFSNQELSPAESYKIEIKNIDKDGTSALSTIDIRAEKADINILPTDGNSYIFFENPDASKTSAFIENGTLKITDTVPFYIMGLSFENGKMKFAGFRNVFTQGLYSGGEKSITVYLNNADVIKNIKITLSIGNVSVAGISVEELNVTSSFGNAVLSQVDISSTAKISLKKGNVNIKDCSYVFTDIFTSVGDIFVQTNGRKTNCEATVGDINIMYDKNIDDYDIRASLASGKIFLDGAAQKGKEFIKNAVDADSLWLKTSKGNISFYKSVTSE